MSIYNEPNLKFIQTPLNRYTFKSPKMKKWVQGNIKGKTLNLFAGKIRLTDDNYTCKEVRVDADVTMDADFFMDAYEYVLQCEDTFDTILLDPPYQYRKAMEMYNGQYSSKFKLIADEIPKLLNKNGNVISFGYHSTYLGKIRQFKLSELCVFAHSGAQHCTIAIVEEKI